MTSPSTITSFSLCMTGVMHKRIWCTFFFKHPPQGAVFLHQNYFYFFFSTFCIFTSVSLCMTVTTLHKVCSSAAAGLTVCSALQTTLLSLSSALSMASLVTSVPHCSVTSRGSTPLCLLLLIFSTLTVTRLFSAQVLATLPGSWFFSL